MTTTIVLVGSCMFLHGFATNDLVMSVFGFCVSTGSVFLLGGF